MSTELRKRFLEQLKQRLLSVYRQSEQQRTPSARERFQLEGYMDAALETGLIEQEVLQAFIHQVHFDVFGQSIQERRDLRKSRGDYLKEPDSNYESYDSPTWKREGVEIKIS